MGLVQNPESRVRAAAKKHLGEEAAGALWIAIKRVLPQVVCFRSFGNLIGAPPSGGGGGAIRSSTRIQNPKIRVLGWPLHWHLSNGPLSKPTAIQTLLESGLEQTVDPPGRDSLSTNMLEKPTVYKALCRVAF